VTRIRWWAGFLGDVVRSSVTSTAAGVIFGGMAFVDDLRWAWRRRPW
jgi:hypothetical protein